MAKLDEVALVSGPSVCAGSSIAAVPRSMGARLYAGRQRFLARSHFGLDGLAALG